MSLLDIVIVNWNGGAQLRKCVESIFRFASPSVLGQIVIVDNASSDRSADELDALEMPIVMIRNAWNRGFGAACNQGAAICQSKYLLFLNPDTELQKESLSIPLTFMECRANVDVGACGIQLVNSAGEVTRSCARFPTGKILVGQSTGLCRVLPQWFPNVHLSEWNHKESRDVDHVIGAFYVIRRQLFVALKGFDERYFVYLEDLDLSKAVVDHGCRIVYLATAQAFHEGGGTSRQVKARRLFYSRRSRIQYAFKHLTIPPAIVVALSTLSVEPLVMLVYGLIRLSFRQICETFSGFAMLWWDIPSLLLSSWRVQKSEVLTKRGVAPSNVNSVGQIDNAA